MYTLAAGALGVFAAGTVNGRATVWYSTDAHSWSVISGAGTAINHDPGAVINDLLMTPSGVFAAGSSVSSNSLSAALWYSTDGLHWDTVRSAEATFSGNGDHEITSLVDMGETGSSQLGSPGPTSLLAVGGVRSGANWQPASWISPDGVSWSQASESFPLDNEPSGSLGALAYAATSAGQHVLAVGGSPSRQRLWVSSAGQAWSEVPLPATAAGATNWHLGLVAGTSTTTVVADNLPGQPYVLVRSGGTWHEPSARGTFGKPLQTAVPTSLVSDNGTLVMSVQRSGAGDALGSGTTSVALLTSADGKTWRVASTDAFDNATVNQLLPVQGGLLAVGSARASSHSHGMPGALVAVSGEAGRVWRTTGISPGGLGQGSQGAVAAGRLGQSEYVVGRAGTQAVSWYSPDGATWEPSRPLDPAPELGVEQPLATCSGPDDAVVVGSVTQTARGTVAAAWVSTDGSSWSNATIVPGQPPGASAVIEGCLFTGNGFIAYGETTGSGEAEGPALWSSTDGTTWQRQTAIFVGLSGRGPVGAEASPLDGIAYGSTTWLGVSGQGDLPTQRWPAPAGGAAGAAPLSAGLWASLDAGSTWQQLSTGMPPFVSAIYAQTDQAVYVGQQPVVAGTVDGKLAVWVGSPTPTDGT
jgi:hypothetical protein